MKENESALYSQYIIDGIRCDMTPAELLEECMDYDDYVAESENKGSYSDIIDESTEPPLSSFHPEKARLQEYMMQTEKASYGPRQFTMLYPEHFTRLQIAMALTSRLWSKGHFRLGNLRIWAQWDWNTRPVGNMAAFYASAGAASDYIYGLGVKMTDYLFLESDGESNARFFAWLPEGEMPETSDEEQNDTTLFKSSPYESRHPWISDSRMCSSSILPDEDSWIIYIPFDTCSYRLGGSLLAQTNGRNGGPGPQIQDPDYFIDCYEVIRELVEDGIVLAGASVGDGGLATAAGRMCQDCGMKLDVRGLMESYQETDIIKVLFGETPGVLIQIRSNDYDYLDSQLILQDVAYYPLGHPTSQCRNVVFSSSGESGVAGILASLLNQASEGED